MFEFLKKLFGIKPEKSAEPSKAGKKKSAPGSRGKSEKKGEPQQKKQRKEKVHSEKRPEKEFSRKNVAEEPVKRWNTPQVCVKSLPLKVRPAFWICRCTKRCSTESSTPDLNIAPPFRH